jgi:hypothetical protein
MHFSIETNGEIFPGHALEEFCTIRHSLPPRVLP